MSNPFNEIRNAVSEAQLQLRAADETANDLARLLEGRLQHVSTYVLVRLKKELRDFDAHRRVWK